MGSHGYSWVLMGTHGFSVGSHGFSWVLSGYSDCAFLGSQVVLRQAPPSVFSTKRPGTASPLLNFLSGVSNFG